jgi:hypothetical protein
MVKAWYLMLAAAIAVTLPLAEAKERKIPLPRLKPASLEPASPATVAKPETPASKLAFPSAPLFSGWSARTIKAERAECAARLDGLRITFEAMPPLGKEGGCGAAAPIMVTSMAGVAIVPPAEMTCDLAEAVHGWVSSSLVPAARQHLKKKLVKINNASAYACRRRNNARSGKLSEHGKANALDIATLAFNDGSTTSIKGDWSGLRQIIGMSGKGNFLRQIRRDACIRFTTVLGPGSDSYHGDHFHVDVTRRRNGYRICK